MQQQSSFNLNFLGPSKEGFCDYLLFISEFHSVSEDPLAGKETDGNGKMRGTGLSVHSLLYA